MSLRKSPEARGGRWGGPHGGQDEGVHVAAGELMGQFELVEWTPDNSMQRGVPKWSMVYTDGRNSWLKHAETLRH